jgi:hypothetical protein
MLSSVIFDTKMKGVCLPHNIYAPSNTPSGVHGYLATQDGVNGWQVLVKIKIGGFEVDFSSLVLNFAFLNFSIESQLNYWILSAETCTDIHKDLGTVGLNVFHCPHPSVVSMLAILQSNPFPHIFSFIYGKENKFIIGEKQPNLEFAYIDVVVAVCLYLCLSFFFDSSYIGEKLGH